MVRDAPVDELQLLADRIPEHVLDFEVVQVPVDDVIGVRELHELSQRFQQLERVERRPAGRTARDELRERHVRRGDVLLNQECAVVVLKLRALAGAFVEEGDRDGPPLPDRVVGALEGLPKQVEHDRLSTHLIDRVLGARRELHDDLLPGPGIDGEERLPGGATTRPQPDLGPERVPTSQDLRTWDRRRRAHDTPSNLTRSTMPTTAPPRRT